MQLIFIFLFIVPIPLTIWNLYCFLFTLLNKTSKKYEKHVELVAIFIGAITLYAYISFEEILFLPWDTQLYNGQEHSIVDLGSFPTIIILALFSLIGYVFIRFSSHKKQPPLLLAVGVATLYCGIIICTLWCIQTFSNFILVLFPFNVIIIFIKTIYLLVSDIDTLIKNNEVSYKYKKLSKLFTKANKLPLVALVLLLPLLGLIIIVLTLFGQEPDSIIKAWTNTADWTMSQQTAPQNIQYDEHYLCTVAASGHRKIVRPLRTGVRHGHRVVVNRQLCIANAFEQILEEKTPRLHKITRGIYDKVGYPIGKHIKSLIIADIIYILMKPLELFFLIVLYITDTNPENRIALQYPHKV